MRNKVFGALIAVLGVFGAAEAEQVVPVKKLAPYLYETWYDGYECCDLTGDDGPFGDLPAEGLGGCSSVRVGDFHGRNLDIGVSDCATVVVHMKSGKERLASVGTTQWGDVTETALSTNGVSAHRFAVLPNWMLDGINEKGVAINVNVVPLDVPQSGEGPDNRPSLHAREVVRYVLDHAVSATDAVETLKRFRIHGNIGTGTYYLHWMISDVERTFVVEIIKGEVVAREHPIMTNFNLNWDNKNRRAITPAEFAQWGSERYVYPAVLSDPEMILDTYTPHADGIERYLTLRDAPYKEKGATFEGMFELMRSARYSRVTELPLERTFRSDLTEIDEVHEAGLGSLVKIYTPENAGKLQQVWAKLRPAMTNVYAHLSDYRDPEELGDYSITTHNVTFDLRKRMFRIVVQEDYDHPHDIWLAQNDVEVKCRNGVFVGERDAQTKIVSFKGIPYAKPPVGALRWKAPVAADASSVRREAKAFGFSALQSVDKGEAASKREKSEDCLTLNVWTTDLDAKKRPVMVFIHGGSYGWGGSSDPLYDGAPFVAENPDIVLVTINYRVNFMGFIDFAKVPGGEAFPDAPYLGLLDQQLALRWVKENIAGFGGDPENVTIFGESAGGGSVSCHLVMPGSKDLFRRAIVMSGTLDLTCSQTMLDNRGQTELLLKAAGVRDMAGLMALSEKDLLKLMFADCGKENPEGVDSRVSDSNNWPMRGGRSPIPANPFAAVKDGASKDVDVMIGTVADEMRYWAYLQVDDDRPDDSLAGYREWLDGKLANAKRFFGPYADVVDEFLKIAPRERDAMDAKYPNIWRDTELLNELWFRQASIRMAEDHATAGGKGRTYMYLFGKGLKNPDYPWMRAAHACELQYCFNNLKDTGDGPIEPTLARRFSRVFAAFARTGDPSAEGVAWPQYDAKDRMTMVYGDDSSATVVSDPKSEQRKILQPHFLVYWGNRE